MPVSLDYNHSVMHHHQLPKTRWDDHYIVNYFMAIADSVHVIGIRY